MSLYDSPAAWMARQRQRLLNWLALALLIGLGFVAGQPSILPSQAHGAPPVVDASLGPGQASVAQPPVHLIPGEQLAASSFASAPRE